MKSPITYSVDVMIGTRSIEIRREDKSITIDIFEGKRFNPSHTDSPPNHIAGFSMDEEELTSFVSLLSGFTGDE